jgi:type I restriction enzyme S subunit
MSKLEELIAELCPDGVEYKALGEIARYSNDRIDAKVVNEQTYVGVDNLLPEKQGKTFSSYVSSNGRLIHFKASDILIGNIRPI